LRARPVVLAVATLQLALPTSMLVARWLDEGSRPVSERPASWQMYSAEPPVTYTGTDAAGRDSVGRRSCCTRCPRTWYRPAEPRALVARASLCEFEAVPRRHALLTGATGWIASHLLPALLADGWTVRACGRRPRPHWFPEQVDYRSVDLTGDEGLGGLYDGVTHLFHLAGASSSTATEQEMHRSNVLATRQLLAAAPPGLERVLYMSSSSVYGEEVQLPSPVTEDVPPSPSRGYGKAKWESEQEVWAQGAAGLPVVVLRPVSIFGPGNIKLLGSAVLDTALEAWAGLDTLAVHARPIEQRLVHIEDLVRASLHLVEHEAAVGHAYNVVTEDHPSSHDLASILAEGLGMRLELADEPDCGLGYEDRSATRQQMLGQGMQPHILLTEQRLRLLRKANRNNRLSVDALLATDFRFARADLGPAIHQSIEWYRNNRWILTR